MKLHRPIAPPSRWPDVGTLDRIEDDSALTPGTHLVTPRRRYTHHGIYVGADTVIHYAGWCRQRTHGPIEEISVAEFTAKGALGRIAHSTPRFGAIDVVVRARSRLGEDAYDLLTNNCEHFCNWCIEGRAYSEQVEWLRAAAPRWLERWLERTAPALLPQ